MRCVLQNDEEEFERNSKIAYESIEVDDRSEFMRNEVQIFLKIIIPNIAHKKL